MAGELIIPNGAVVSGSFVITGSVVATQALTVAGSPVITSNETGSFNTAQDRKHDFNDPYSYCGLAPIGSSTSSNVWSITRIDVAPNGTSTKASASNASWDNRYNTIYN
jgi:hypothetical protein